MPQWIIRLLFASSALVLTGLLVSGNQSASQAQIKKSDAVVHVTAKGEKPDSDGKQIVTLTIKIDKGWHIYANPVGEESFKSVQTVVTLTGESKVQNAKIEYPPGKTIKDTKLEIEYRIYEGTIKIKAVVQRAKGDTGALECGVKVYAETDTTMLMPAIVKVPVE